MMDYRIEKDSMGEIAVESKRLWGAQTQRSLENFPIGIEKMPMELIQSLATLKMAAALANRELGILEPDLSEGIIKACKEIIEGMWDDHFPLSVWQTGSGTQTNMNLNEVIANRANGSMGEKKIHPNDHVNMGQSSNDTFPTAIHMATVIETEERLLPALERLSGTFKLLSERYLDVVKIGRTHFQDAVPLTLGQEISAWHSMLEHGKDMILSNIKYIRELALGGTAVGTGLNTHKDFSRLAVGHISRLTGTSFVPAPNKFHALTSKDGMVIFHGALKALAADLYKIAGDVRMLASGPRAGIGEIKIPENEPGSSIMPGKVNPTQCEALSMVCCQVMANDGAVSFGASQGHFQLNVFLPVIAYNMLQSIRLLGDAMDSFNDNCALGIRPDYVKIKANLDRSLMLVTALSPKLGYDKAAVIAKKAHEEGTTLKKAAVDLGYVTEAEYDILADPKKMV